MFSQQLLFKQVYTSVYVALLKSSVLIPAFIHLPDNYKGSVGQAETPTQFNYNQVGQPVVNQIIGQAQQFVAKYASDPFAGVQTLTINQQPDCIECICPCIGEKRNHYDLSASDASGAVMMHNLGRIDEFSECPSRFFCQCWRAMELSFLTPQQQVAFHAKREYKVPAVFMCPCGERPELIVNQNEQILGRICQPFMCCGRSECPFPILEEIDIIDASGNRKYYITGEFVQMGCVTRMCLVPRCCGSCRYIRYDICSDQHQKVGSITNVFNGCINEYCTKADKFVIDFPKNADFADKALIVMAAITIDYDNFEYTFCNLP